MAKKNLTYILKDKNRKETNSFAKAKYFAVKLSRKSVIRQQEFPKGYRTAKKKIELLEEVFSYIELLQKESEIKREEKIKARKKEKIQSGYDQYLSDVANSKPDWKNSELINKIEIIEEEEKRRRKFFKEKKLKYKKPKKQRTRFSYYNVPVITKSKIYKKHFRFRVIYSKQLRSRAEELEFFTDLREPIDFSSLKPKQLFVRLKKIFLPHAFKAFDKIKKRRKKINFIFRAIYDFDGKGKKINAVGSPRYIVRNHEDIENVFNMIMEDAIFGTPADQGAWKKYLIDMQERKLFIRAFNAQFVYSTRFTSTETMSDQEYKRDFIGTVKRKR